MKFQLDNVKAHHAADDAYASFVTSSDPHDDYKQLAMELAETKQALQFALELAQFATAPVYEDLVNDAYDDLEEYHTK